MLSSCFLALRPPLQCHMCGKTGDQVQLQLCARCRFVGYCSRQVGDTRELCWPATALQARPWQFQAAGHGWSMTCCCSTGCPGLYWRARHRVRPACSPTCLPAYLPTCLQGVPRGRLAARPQAALCRVQGDAREFGAAAALAGRAATEQQHSPPIPCSPEVGGSVVPSVLSKQHPLRLPVQCTPQAMSMVCCLHA